MPFTVWKGYISFGLVSFPIRLFAAARPDPVHFHMLHAKDSSRVKEVFYCAEENKPIPRDEIVKGYEFKKGQYVVVEPGELKKIAPETASVMEIESFVKADEVDPIYLEKSYYVAPEEKLKKPYALLAEAMRQTGHYAIAKLTMHDREHIVVLRPSEDGLIAHTMFFESEMHSASRAGAGKQAVTKKELEMAGKLIESLTAPFQPRNYKDEYRANVERLIGEKRKGRKVTTTEQPKIKPVTDIMEALKQSLARSGKKTSSPKSTKTKPRNRAA